MAQFGERMLYKMSKYGDLVGQKYGKLLVINKAEDYISPSGGRGRQWLCKCECGKECVKRETNLISGSTKSCGCGRAENLVGRRYNLLTVIERDQNKVYSNGHTYVMWICKCDCGNIISVSALHLKNGHTKSCGCLHIENARNMNYVHGAKSSGDTNSERLYSVWCSMKDRCYNPNCNVFKHYGGRGIIVCDEWKHNYVAFYNWAMQNGYNPYAKRGECTLDRINVEGNYSPENCRWVSQIVQCNNTRRNKYYTYNGESHTIREWSEITSIPMTTLSYRLKNHWSYEKAFNIQKGGEAVG